MNKQLDICLVPSNTYKLRAVGFSTRTGKSGSPYVSGSFRIINKCEYAGKIIELGFSLSPKCRYIVTAWLGALGFEPDSIEKAIQFNECELQSMLEGCCNKVIKCSIGVGIHPNQYQVNVVRPPTNIQAAVASPDDIKDEVHEDCDDKELKEKSGNVAGEIDIDNISIDEI